jgi:hypothetical protein
MQVDRNLCGVALKAGSDDVRVFEALAGRQEGRQKELLPKDGERRRSKARSICSTSSFQCEK